MTPAPSPEALLRSLAGRVAVSLSSLALRLGRFASARDRAVRSADLPCRCGHRQDAHLPAEAGGCIASSTHEGVCQCRGFALDSVRAAHPSATLAPVVPLDRSRGA